LITLVNPSTANWGTLALIGTGTSGYIFCRDFTGFVVWAARLGSIGTVGTFPENIITHSDGSVYLIGQYSNTLQIYNGSTSSGGGALWGTLPLVSTAADIFVLKYNSAGAVQWVARMGSTSSDVENITENLGIDSTGAIYFQVGYGASLAIYNGGGSGGGTLWGSVASVSTLLDVCLIKINSAGAVQWACKMGSVFTSDTPSGVVVSGSYVYSVTAGSANISIYNSNGTLAKTQTGGTYVIKWDLNGNYQWSTLVTTNATSWNVVPVNIVANNNGDVITVISCYANNNLMSVYDSSNTLAITKTVATYAQPLYVCWTSSGAFKWASVATTTATLTYVGPNAVYPTSTSGYAAVIMSPSTAVSFQNPEGTVSTTQSLISGGTGTDMFLAGYIY
jgi:hypothetical protein